MCKFGHNAARCLTRLPKNCWKLRRVESKSVAEIGYATSASHYDELGPFPSIFVRATAYYKRYCRTLMFFLLESYTSDAMRTQSRTYRYHLRIVNMDDAKYVWSTHVYSQLKRCTLLLENKNISAIVWFRVALYLSIYLFDSIGVN